MAVQIAVNGISSVANSFAQPTFVIFLYWVLQSLGTLISHGEKSDRLQDEGDLVGLKENQTFDFIVVGSGAGGGVVANRLVRANYRVLLLENGGDPRPLQFMPRINMLNYPQVDWMHRTVPQQFATQNSINRKASWSAGKTLGGSGTLNFMVHLRGHRRDFDNWGNITGDPQWNWNGVLPFFRSYEDYEIAGDNVNHGYGGDLRIEKPDYSGLAPEFIRGGAEMGYPQADLNAPFGEGFDVIRYPIKRGVRQATFKAFIEPLRTQPKRLTILKYSHVNRILFRDGNVAYGVQFDRHGRSSTAFATNEVIICAGAVGSPKLLMLSGIGPRKHLEDLNIPVRVDLPVGRNLQDHLGVFLGPFFINQPRSTYIDRDLTPTESAKWFTKGTGQLSSTGFEATGLISSDLAKARGEADWPDIQLSLFSLAIFRTASAYISRAYNLNLDDLNKYYETAVGRDSVHIFISGARPFARGSLELGGSSSYDKPIINPNYLGDDGEQDLSVLLEGVKRAVFLMENTTSFGGALGARFTDVRLPGCENRIGENLEFRSDPYWQCYIRRYSVSMHNPVGSAPMGTVVDSELKVLGTQRLRLIDASVQPVIVSTGTEASTLMIGEKGADMIIREWTPVNNRPLLSKQELQEQIRLHIVSKVETTLNKLKSNSI